MGLNGLPQRIFNEIAKDQKIVHLWLKEIFELKSNTKADKMMDEMMETFQKEVLEPTLPKLIQGNADPRRVTRAVFIVLPIYLERKAIAEWIQNSMRSFSPLMFPQGPRAVLPEINTPHEAAELAARELMLNSQEKELVKIIVSAGEGLQNFCSEIESSLINFQRHITHHRNSDAEQFEEQEQRKQKNAEDATEIKIGNEVYYAYLQSDGTYIIDTIFTNLNHVQETCKALNIEFEDRGYKFVIEKNIKDPNNPFSEIDYTIKAIAIDNYNRMIQSHKEDISTKVLKEILPPDRFQEMMALRELVRQKNEEMYKKQALAKKQNPEQNTGQTPK